MQQIFCGEKSVVTYNWRCSNSAGIGVCIGSGLLYTYIRSAGRPYTSVTMSTHRAAVKALALFCFVVLCVEAVSAQSGSPRPPRGLRVGFYSKTCPRAEALIRAAVVKGVRADPTLPAGLIRMFFHDCFVRGCDASVLLDNPDSEKLGAPNANSLRGFQVLDEAKASCEAACPGVVSCADVIAYAARDSLELAGKVRVGAWYGGRRDGDNSVSADTLTELPAPFSNFSTLQKAFEKKGLNQADLVILSGAHSIGTARCGIILGRLYNFKGTGKADPAYDPKYVTALRLKCPSNAPGNRISMEEKTPNVLDVNYYNDVSSGRGLFESDNALRTTAVSRFLVTVNRIKMVFDPAFINSMRKMGNIGVLTGSQGRVRRVCNVTSS